MSKMFSNQFQKADLGEYGTFFSKNGNFKGPKQK